MLRESLCTRGWFAGVGAAALVMALLVLVAAAQAAGPLSWGSPLVVDHQRPYMTPGSLTAVSCPSVRLCAAADDAGDVITSTSPTGPGSSWTPDVTNAGSLTGISCPTTRLCVAVGWGGKVLVSEHPRGGAWSAARVDRYTDPFDGRPVLDGVSCASASLCVAFDRFRLFVSSDPAGGVSAWKPVLLEPSPHGDTTPQLTAVSCPSRSFCMAVDTAGHAFTSVRPGGGGKAWRASHIDTSQNLCGTSPVTFCQAALIALSCPSRSFCAALDTTGNVLTSTRPTGGSTPWPAVAIDFHIFSSGLRALFCHSKSLCVAIDQDGTMFVSRQPTGGVSAWHAIKVSLYGLVADSCPSASWCVVAGQSWNIIALQHLRRGSPARHAFAIRTGGFNSLMAISCPTVSFCVMGDNAGHVVTSARPAGGVRAWRSSRLPTVTVDEEDFGQAALAPISCPSTSFCVANGNSYVLTSHRPAGGARTWKATPLVNQNGGFIGVGGLSCPTTSLCVGLGDRQILTASNPAGGVGAWSVQYTDSAPEPPQPPCFEHCGPAPGGITALSCPKATLCVAVDGNGDVITSTDPAGGPSAWKTTTSVVPGCASGFCYSAGISCPSVSVCVMSDNGSILTSSSPASGKWKVTPVPGGAPTIFTASCPSARLCVGVRGSDLVLSTNPAGGRWITAYVDRFPPLSLALTEAYGPNQYSPLSIDDVSCPSPSLCLAVDGLGRVVVGKTTPGG